MMKLTLEHDGNDFVSPKGGDLLPGDDPAPAVVSLLCPAGEVQLTCPASLRAGELAGLLRDVARCVEAVALAKPAAELAGSEE